MYKTLSERSDIVFTVKSATSIIARKETVILAKCKDN